MPRRRKMIDKQRVLNDQRVTIKLVCLDEEAKMTRVLDAMNLVEVQIGNCIITTINYDSREEAQTGYKTLLNHLGG